MARGFVVAAMIVAVLAAGGDARAQEGASTIELRLAPSFSALAAPIAAGVERRTGRAVVLGAALDDDEPHDLGPHVVGIVRGEGRMRVFAIAGSGNLHVTDVGAPEGDALTTRVLVVALASFLEGLDADAVPPAEPASGPPRVVETYELPVDGSALEDLAPPYRPLSFEPGFVLELRERVAYATQRDAGSTATGLMVGVCFGTWWCVVLDADVMAPEEDHALSAGMLSYVSTTVGLGGRFLPLEAGPVRGGVGIDATTRIAEVWTESPSASSTTVAPGMRLLADGTVRLAGVVSLALTVGADISFSAVRFVRGGNGLFTEDVVTLWAALGLRIGPF